MEKLYKIKKLASISGVKPHTLRAWEQRYGVFSPIRDDSGQRLYGEEDIEKAKLLGLLVGSGHSISSVANLSLKDLESMVDEESPAVSYDSDIDRLFSLLENYKVYEFSRELSYLRDSLGTREFIFQIVLPVIRKAGELVQEGVFTVTQEHIISSVVRDQVSQMSHVGISDRGEHRYALATPDGNNHELSILIARALCGLHRVQTLSMGASHPADCLGQSLSLLNCNFLILGVISSNVWNINKKLVPFLKQLDESLESTVEVILGGGGIEALPKFKNIKKVHQLKNFEELERFLKKHP